MKSVYFVIIVLFALALFAMLCNSMNEAHKQAVFQATLKKLAKFNYEFIVVNNQSDWDEYIIQLEVAVTGHPNLYEKNYLNECKKKQQPQKELP
jgi:hypothetical protein